MWLSILGPRMAKTLKGESQTDRPSGSQGMKCCHFMGSHFKGQGDSNMEGIVCPRAPQDSASRLLCRICVYTVCALASTNTPSGSHISVSRLCFKSLQPQHSIKIATLHFLSKILPKMSPLVLVSFGHTSLSLSVPSALPSQDNSSAGSYHHPIFNS